MDLFKGYVLTKNKRCLEKFKDRTDLKTYEQVKDLEEFAGILSDDAILIDIDDSKQSDILMDIVEDLQLNCRVYQTTRGRHFFFKNTDVNACGTHCKLAVGLEADIKVGKKNSYSVLKFNGEERFIEWDTNVKGEYDPLPKWLLRVRTTQEFLTMEKGDGRNQALFNYILTLQSNGFSKDEATECIKLINKYILKDPLDEKELDVILRDDAFSKPIFFEKNTFLFDKFANYLKSNYHIVKINNQLHIYKDGIYKNGYEEIKKAMIELIPNLKDTQRTEVLKYLELICENIKTSDANFIAFKNGIYDIAYNRLVEYTPDIIITNRIDWNYYPDAECELADKTLDKLACNDESVRSLLEECIGYTFYRRNELGKAFVLTGEKSNGKSTYLDLIGAMLGEENISSLDIKELGDRFSSSMMFGKLANIGDDIGDDFLQGNAVSIFKKVVTGNRIKAERKGQDPFEFNPYIKLLFSANDIPRMRDKTGAVLRRLVIIPFNATFSKDDADYDPFIKYKLIQQDSIEYLIKVGIQGLRRVLTNQSFTESEKVLGAIAEYEEENNPILGFIKSLDITEIVNEPSNEVYLRYSTYCSQNNFQAVSNVSFSKQLCRQLNLKVVDKFIDGKKRRIFVNY